MPSAMGDPLDPTWRREDLRRTLPLPCLPVPYGPEHMTTYLQHNALLRDVLDQAIDKILRVLHIWWRGGMAGRSTTTWQILSSHLQS